MKTRSIKLSVIIVAAFCAHQASAIDVTVDAHCNIYGAGHPPPNDAPTVGPHGGGVPPIMISLAALSNAPVLQFSASGGVSYCPTCGNNGPDGANFIAAGPGYNGISGITNFPGRSLVAVFTSETEPANPAPPSLDFGILGTNYLILAPQLQQQFFIGDGFTAAGVAQAIRVPAGATRLYVGLLDGYTYDDTPDGYEDNSGSFSVTVNPALYLGIEYSTGKPGISVFGPSNSTNRIEYVTSLSSNNWTIVTNVVLTNIPVFFYDASASDDPTRFYRAHRFP